MFKKDNFIFGLVLGAVGPLVGLLLLKYYKFDMLTFREVFDLLRKQPGHGMLSAGLSVSLMVNALFFTIYINKRKDETGKGLFVTTLVYGVVILLVKYLS
jgi:hypothetical protein